MEKTKKWLTGICAVFMAVSLTLAVLTLILLRRDIRACIVPASEPMQEEPTVAEENSGAKTAEEPEKSVDADVLYDVFCVRETRGKIGIFTSEGYLVRMLDVDVSTLPEADRSALASGIAVTSWDELIALIQDYEE